MKNIKNFRFRKSSLYKIGYTTKATLLLLCLSLFIIQARASVTVNSIEVSENVQQRNVTGIVTDKNGTPLPGVTIIIEGTSRGTDTDFDGKYSISANSGDVLVFSYIGMTSQTLKIENKLELNVILLEDSNVLDEVVVVGYGTKKKINLSGAVAVVGEDVFEDRPVTTVGQALQGTIANLNVVSSGSPNTVPDFNIRGVTSLAGGEPLVVIDGVTATQSDLARMNPNDIASVTILKDAAAASIYGSRASFGVLLVTTKSGKSDKMNINVAVNTRIQTLGRFPELELDVAKVLPFLHDMAKPWYNLFTQEQFDYAEQVSLGNAEPTRISPTDPNKYEYFHSTNWRETVLNDVSYSTSANMNISQKLDKGSYYISVEGVKNSGIYKYNNDVQKRFNIRLKSDYDLTSWLNLSNNTWIYNNEYDESNATGSAFMRQVMGNRSYLAPYNPDGTYTEYGAYSIGRLLGGNYNTNENGYQTSFALKAKFFEDRLTVVGDGSFKRLLTDREAYDTPVQYSSGPNPQNIGYEGPSEAWASFANWREEWNNYNVYATFNDLYNEKHNVTVLAGYNQEEHTYNRTGGQRSGLISAGLPSVELATGNQEVSHSYSSWAVQGMFARLNYIYDDKYIVEVNGRYDGSSRYYKEDRWVFNPSASASWIASKENFLEDSFFDLLKFRVSYGSLGNQNAGSYATYPFLGTGNASSLIGGENIVEASSPGLIAPSFSWETIKTKNIGVDLAFLNNRLTSSFDYYHRLTLDMFAPGLELPVVLGTAVPDENATDLRTEGWEFNVSWRDEFDISNKPFKYSATFNLGDSRAFITKFPNPTNSLSRYRVGEEIGEIWGFVSDGYYQTQEEIDFGPDHTDVASYPSTRPQAPGDIRFKDLNGDGVISYGDNTLDNPGDRKIIGNSRARYNFGLDLNAQWNGFDLKAFFQGVGKKDYYPGGWQDRYYFWSAFAFPWSSVTKENYNNHWTPENRNAFYPRPKSYVAEGGKEVSLSQTRWLQDASYVRLKNVTLGYTLPENATKNIGTIRVFASGENLFEISKLFKYLDPENLNGNGYPFRRTYSIGASIKF